MSFLNWSPLFTLRLLRRQWPYVLVNVSGLALGLAATALILLFVHDELTTDTHHPDAERTYRVTFERTDGESPARYASAPPAVGPALQAQVPAVETAARVSPTPVDLRVGTTTHADENFFFADPSAVDLFAFEPVRGDARSTLSRPNTAVLTEAAAQRLFGSVDVVGQTVAMTRRGESVDLEIGGVVKGLPDNSHLQPSVLASFATLSKMIPWYDDENWIFRGSYTYVRLDESADPETVEQALPPLVRAETTEEQARYGMDAALHLQPLTSIHLHSRFPDEIRAGGNPAYLYLLLGVAAFILLLSAVNYVNLASAQSIERATDVSVRKVFGAERSHLLQQHLGEAVLLAIAGMIVAVELVVLALPLFNAVAATSFTTAQVLTLPAFWGGLILATLVIGIASGLYPALTIARTSPLRVLRGHRTSDPSAPRVRRGLIAVQFGVAMLLLCATFVTSDQLAFMRTADLGFDDEKVVVLDHPAAMQSQSEETVKARLSNHPQVQSVSFTSHVPTRGDRFNTRMRPSTASQDVEITGYRVDPSYLATLGHSLAAGRNFEPERASDSSAVLVNEAAARSFGWANPVGRTLVQPQGDGEVRRFRVIGVVEDFHARSLRHEVAPVVVQLSDHRRGFVAVRLAGGDVRSVLDHLSGVWSELAPQSAFQYAFLNDSVDAQYRAEERLTWLLQGFSGLAVLIACIGLGGLSAYLARRRTREVGIRKSLGATTLDVLALLTKDFAGLVAAAVVVTAPVAFVLLHTWLQQFAYRTSLDGTAFLGAATLVLVLAVTTVAVQAVRAAGTDPVTAIREG